MLKARKIQRRKKLARYMRKATRKKAKLPDHMDIVIKQQTEGYQQGNVTIKQQDKIDFSAWEDPDDEQMVDLNQMNMLKKLRKNDQSVRQSTYEGRLRAYYNQQHPSNMASWVQAGEAEDEKDIEDYLNTELFSQNFKNNKRLEIQHLAKNQKRHDSVVTGLQWKNKVICSTGLDKTLRLWTFNEERPEFNKSLELLKTIYLENLPLTSCNLLKDKLYMGTLRKNYAIFDFEKSHTTLMTSSYLSKHQNFKNIIGRHQQLGVFSRDTLSLMSFNNSFIGDLKTNEPIEGADITENQVTCVTKQAIYIWDIRRLKIRKVVRESLGYTCVTSVPTENIMAVGSSSGIVYVYQEAGEGLRLVKQIQNLVTTVTGISTSQDGRLLIPYSKWKRNALRVFDTASNSVLNSWPTMHTKLNYPTCSSISHHSGYLSVGSASGIINVYTLQSSNL